MDDPIKEDFAEAQAQGGTTDRAAAIVDAVVIGRNEGARLVDCITSLRGQFRRIVYVDSGSCDDSLCVARTLGAEAFALDMSKPFTAARARNAGLDQLAGKPPEYVQFIDGDCVLRDRWVNQATDFMQRNQKVAVVCGQRRERYPERSIYNQFCDDEWNTRVGEAKACGGDALMRYRPLVDAGGFRADLIAGEEPELCVRLRLAGWAVWRLDAEMTLHDADMQRVGQWFRRARRAGHAFAEGAAIHGKWPERHWVGETRRAVFWGLLLPVLALTGSLSTPWTLVLLLAYPLQVMRLAFRSQPRGRAAWLRALWLTLAKFPEVLGVLDYVLGRLSRRKVALIEYK